MAKIDGIKAEKEIHFSATFHETDDLDYNYTFDKAVEKGWVTDYVLHFSMFNEGDRMDALVNMLKDKVEYFGDEKAVRLVECAEIAIHVVRDAGDLVRF